MKRIILGILAVSAMLCGCQKNDVSEQVQESATLQATIEDVASTKTVMDANNNILWQEGDQIVAFMKSSYRHKYQLLSSYAGKAYADFEPVSSGNGGNLSAGTEWDHNVAYYPYSETVECLKFGSNYVIDVVLPSEQTYAPESFGNGSMAMVAVSEDNNITFRNVLGGMKLQLKGTQTVTSITLQGKNSEKLSGAATVTAYTDEIKPAITMASDASTSVTLNCGSGVQLNETTATEFIIALPPVLFSQGFTVTITDDAGNEQTIETDKENSVLRSSLLVMPEVTLDKVPQTGDYVDEYGIIHGPGVKIGETVWAPVNCGYHATDYKYGKLYQWGRKYGQGYSTSYYYDASVPEKVEGPISAINGQKDIYSNTVFTASGSPYDWTSPQKDDLWNSGTEDNPVKTEYDPCPEGWRVPTYAELDELNNNYSSWTTDDNGRRGRWFSGPNSYTASVPQVFFPAAGFRYNDNGNTNNRDLDGGYWSSRPNSSSAYYLQFHSSSVNMYDHNRAVGFSVRCVKEGTGGGSSDQGDSSISTSSAVSLTTTGTSNSYIVSQKGTYSFPAVKGNSSASVGSVESAEVLWESFGTDVTPEVGDLVSAALYRDGNIYFKTADTFKEGNAVIAAKDASGNILWSWHIWFTDQPQAQVYNNNAGTMMDRNLGATSSTPGDVGALGLLYQWGRKDPFLGSSSISSSTVSKSTIIWPSAVSSDSSSGTIAYAIANPTTFIAYNKSNNDWYYTGSSSTDNTRWTTSESSKSIYDPCPSGWRVPDGGDNGIWSKAGFDNTTYDSTNQGISFSISSPSTTLYPASGIRDYGVGNLDDVGYGGGCWSASPYRDYSNYAYFLCLLNNGYVYPSDYYTRAYGRSVRCLQE